MVGASSAIGRAVAVELAALGLRPHLWRRDAGRIAAAAVACGGSVDIVDLTDTPAVADSVERVAARGPLRAVVYAAGVFDWAPADEADLAARQEVIAVNLTGAAVLTRLALPALLAAVPSALVYIGSGAAHQAFGTSAAYVASKHGLAGLAGAIFLDVRDRDFKVSLISPGLVAAGAGLRSPAGRRAPEHLLAPEDVAAAVRFVVTFPTRGCPMEIRLPPSGPRSSRAPSATPASTSPADASATAG